MALGATPQEIVGLAFARALVAGEYEAAHAMLSSSLQATTSATQLQAEFERMIDYFNSPPGPVEVSATMDEWPDKQPADVGWVYVAIGDENKTESEAVAVVVTQEQGKSVIREITWGRP